MMMPGARMLLAALLALLAGSFTSATETILFLNGDDSVISAPLPPAIGTNGIYSMSMWVWTESTRSTNHALFSYTGDKDSSFIVRLALHLCVTSTVAVVVALLVDTFASAPVAVFLGCSCTRHNGQRRDC